MTKIYDAGNHILACTGYADPANHRHMAAHIIISIGEMAVESGSEKLTCRGVLIPSGTPHTVITGGENALVFLYDCTTDIARQIKSLCPLPEENCDSILSAFYLFEKDISAVSYRQFSHCVLTHCGLSQMPAVKTDERITAATEYIRRNISHCITCREAAGSVHLSESRFSHLFRQHTGMTFAAYLIYQRIMYAYSLIIQGKSITDAALEAGFSSSAHFSDVNRRIFGIPASAITRDLLFTKIN